MMELLVILASTMTTEHCIQRLQQAIDELKEAELLSNEEEIKGKTEELLLSTHLMTLHIMNKKKGAAGALDTIERLKEVERAHKFFQTAKN